ncbi:TPA: hypothetical protein ACF3LW_004246 [Klebsiella oxytoca]
MNIETVNELIASLESAGELSIKERKYLELAKAFKKLAAENVALKAGVAEEIEVINRGGQMYCVKDGMSINPIYARGWNDLRANVTAVQTPATDRIVAGIKADGVEQAANECYGAGYICETLLAYAQQLREGADK